MKHIIILTRTILNRLALLVFIINLGFSVAACYLKVELFVKDYVRICLISRWLWKNSLAILPYALYSDYVPI